MEFEGKLRDNERIAQRDTIDNALCHHYYVIIGLVTNQVAMRLGVIGLNLRRHKTIDGIFTSFYYFLRDTKINSL